MLFEIVPGKLQYFIPGQALGFHILEIFVKHAAQ